MIAVVGGVVVLCIILIAVLMMMGGEKSSPAPAPASSSQGTYDPDTAGQTVPVPDTGEDDAPALEEEPAAEEVEVPDDAPSVEDPTSIEGCVGWFTGDSFDEDEQVWKDKSGKGNDCTETRGTIFKTNDSNGVTFIQGTKEDGLKFPKECMTKQKKHTFISVARYTSLANANDNHRIFDGVDSNYLTGFHAYGPCHGIAGSAHREGTGWIGHWECVVHHHRNSDGNPAWILHTDQKSKLWVNGALKTGNTWLSEQRTTQMTINYGLAGGWGQYSNWSVGECIFYDRELSADEIEKVELMLHKKWKIPRRIQSPVWIHNNVWSRWWKPNWTNQDALKSLGRFGVNCGDKGLNDNTRFIMHGGISHANGNWGNDGGCRVNAASGPGAKKSSPWTDTADHTSWQARLQKAFDIDCGKQGLQNWEFEVNPDGSQIRVNYQCSADKLNTQACQKNFNVGQNNGAENVAMPHGLHSIQAACHPGMVTNKVNWTKINDRWGYESTCCPMEDK